MEYSCTCDCVQATTGSWGTTMVPPTSMMDSRLRFEAYLTMPLLIVLSFVNSTTCTNQVQVMLRKRHKFSLFQPSSMQLHCCKSICAGRRADTCIVAVLCRNTMKQDLPLPRTVATRPLSNTCSQLDHQSQSNDGFLCGAQQGTQQQT